MKTFILFFLTISFWAQLNANEKKSIRLGVVNYPPYYDFSVPQKPKGIVLDAISEILSKSYNVQWEEIPISRASESLLRNVIDIYLGFRKTPDREEILSFSKTPYIQAQPHLCGDKKAIEVLKKEDKLTGSIVVPRKAKVPARLLKHETLSIDYSNYIQRGLALLNSKRASMVMVPERFMTQLFLKNNQELGCTSFGDPISMYFAYKKYNPLRFEIERFEIPNFTQMATKAMELRLKEK